MADKSRFNNQQWEAIIAPTDEDILISAGAGSGKTNTLSERVSEILLNDALKPSELLVLTFTNNAAHEMKERILAKFPKEQKQKALELLSSHIQTFDSLYQYLVSLYANELGLSNRLNILDETIAKTKRNEIIDDIFLSYYQDPCKRNTLLSFVRKTDMKSDALAKKNVLALWDQLDSLGMKEKADFLTNYDQRFLADDFIRSLYHECVSFAKDAIKETIYEAAFAEYYFDVFSGNDETLEKAKSAFDSQGFWGKGYDAFSFEEDTCAMPLYQEILHLLTLPDEEFVQKAQTLKEDKPTLFPRSIKNLSKEEKPRLEAGWKILKGIFDKKKNTLCWIENLSSLEEEKKKILFYRDDIHLLLDIVKEADTRFEDYKKATNSFSFSDIGNYALRLLTDPKFEKCADEIRGRFSYIMVDEYQDTNPAQEMFLESLLKPNSEGKRAHLFVVGDAKQSIYLFRGSVVALFRERQKRYLMGKGHKVIAMNYNYRSGKRLLDDINYICTFYMRLNHGSIDYQNDPMEHLLYDEKVNLYKLPDSHFGVSRIISPNLPIVQRKLSSANRAKREALTILYDIKKKLDEGYLVYDRKDGIRPCKPSDFAILMRVKKDFRLYERLFTQSGIKLNKVISTNLREANAVILIESLVKMFCYMSEGKGEAKHLFASIARSYAYEYSDSRLYELLRPIKGEEDPLSRLKSDALWIQLKEFAKKNQDSSFRDIFLSLLEEFHVIECLYKIGDVEDNISKIESLYQLVLNTESTGGDIHDFVKMFSEMNRYSLEYSTDSLTHHEDAVDMMSIHASKGLERKIVYMPVSLNAISNGDGRSKPLFSFSLERGIGFPYLQFDPPKPYSPENNYSVSADTLLTRDYDAMKSDPNVDDHVRLFYVALTRAENQIIIVGDDDKKKENLYSMLNCCPHYIRLNNDYFRKKVEEEVLKQADYDAFIKLGEATKTISLPLLDVDLSPEAKRAYEKLGKDYYLSGPLSLQANYLSKFSSLLFDSYRKKLKSFTDFDCMARIYAMYSYPTIYRKQHIDSLASLFNYENSLSDKRGEGANIYDSIEAEELSEFDEGEGPFVSDEPLSEKIPPKIVNEEELKTKVKEFIDRIVEEDYSFFSLQIPKSKLSDDTIQQIMAQEFLPLLAEAFDGASYLAYCSYENDGYKDETTFINDALLEEEVTPPLPSFVEPKLDERPLSFSSMTKKRASKTIAWNDEEVPSSMVLEKGIHLHRLLELVNIATGDVSFIQSEEDRKRIIKVLDLPLMRLAKESEIHSEYQYFDIEAGTSGSIDLLFIHNDEYYIVDYKTSHLDDPAYRTQLLTYSDNVSRIFGVKKEKIHLYLVSILKAIQREITD